MTGRGRSTLRHLQFLLVVVLVSQRLLLPVGAVPLLVVAVPVIALLMLSRGLLRIDRLRATGYLLVVGGCLAVALLSSLVSEPGSITSVGLLVVLYAPVCFVITVDQAEIARRLLGFFVSLCTVFAVIAMVEWAAQLLGWVHRDLLAELLPKSFTYQLFNTNYPIRYGSGILKSNAFFFLEPSVLSQFLALAILAQLVLGRRWARLPLLVLGMLTTVAGTGPVLLAVGLVVLCRLRGLRFAAVVGVALGVLLLGILATPAGAIFSGRATETSSQQSSGSLRFVQPYQLLYDQTLTAPVQALILGSGPGTADRAATAFFARTGLPLVATTVPKLVKEYGIPAALGMTTWVLMCLLQGTPSRAVAAGLLVAFFVLQGALLLPVVVQSCWLLASVLAIPSRPQPDSGRVP